MEEAYVSSRETPLLNTKELHQLLDITNVESKNPSANSASPGDIEARTLNFLLTSSEPCDWRDVSKLNSPRVSTDLSMKLTTTDAHKNLQVKPSDLVLSKKDDEAAAQANSLPTSCSPQISSSHKIQFEIEKYAHVIPYRHSSHAGTALDTGDQELRPQQLNSSKTIKNGCPEYKHNQSKCSETLERSPSMECNELLENTNPREALFAMTPDIDETQKSKSWDSSAITMPELDSDWNFDSSDLEFENLAGLGIELEGMTCDPVGTKVPYEQDKVGIQLSGKPTLNALPALACVRPNSPLSVNNEDLTFFEWMKRAQEDPLLPNRRSCTTENLSIDPRMLSRSSNVQSNLQPGKRKQSSSNASQRNVEAPKPLSSDLRRYRYTWSHRDALGLENANNKVTFVYDESTAQALLNNTISTTKGQFAGKHEFVVTDWCEGSRLYGQ